MERPSGLAASGTDEADLAPTFEDLFAEHHERLFRALYLIVGSAFEAEELMQDAFLGVYERWDRIENPAGYLYRTALNATRSRFKRLTLAAKRTEDAPRRDGPGSFACGSHLARSTGDRDPHRSKPSVQLRERWITR